MNILQQIIDYLNQAEQNISVLSDSVYCLSHFSS